MSSRSLGTLTLDLIAKTGGFESGMDKAARIADKRTREIERQAKERAKAIETAFAGMARAVAGPLAAAFSVGALVDYGRRLADTGKEIQRFSQLTATTTTEFQLYAHGAETAGISSEKFADIVKDVQDKIGEFINTGGGPLKEFFENIAPKIGVTAEQFKNLSGPQALELFYSSLEKANLSQKEMVFWLEAIGNDATLLQPLLKDNAQGFKDAAAEAERFGLILSDETLAGLEEIRKGGKAAQMSFEGWMRQLAEDTLPTLLELSRNMDSVKLAMGGLGDVANLAIRGTLNTLATAAITASKAFEYLGTAIGGSLAALVQAGKGEFSAASETIKALKADLASIDTEYQKSVGRIWTGGTQIPELPKPQIAGTSGSSIKGSSEKKKSDRSKAESDPLTESAKLYEQAMKALDQAQLKADASALNLTGTQAELMRVMSDPLFAQMPEEWRAIITAEAEFVLQTEAAAEEQRRLNELLAATPTAQLEKSRETMLFLASAFEQGKISAEQFSEAAQVALGNIPEAAKPATDTFLDMTLVANDAANSMADAFTNYLFNPMDKSIEEMLASFLKAIAQMIAQALILKAIKTGMSAMGFAFARGGVFEEGGVKAFASGGVVTRPTPFKFASGGQFKSGLMGEAGPEAILPLKRGPDGRLGVTVTGTRGGEDNTVVNITVNQLGGESQISSGTNDDARELANRIKGVVLEVINTQKRPGGLLYR